MSSKSLAYGIDFGTTNSTISIIKDGKDTEKLKIDPISPNPSIMRSIIYAFPDGRFLFGKSAIDAYIVDVARNKEAKKKSIFTGKYIKVTNTATLNAEIVPEIIEVNESQGGRLLQSLKSALSNEYVTNINIFGKVYNLEELVGMFLKEMKNRADNILGKEIDKVVIGRPVEYVGHNNGVAIERMKKALRYAGFKDFVFEFEPVGAAYDYGLNIREKQTALIFDFGGGTLDITITTLPGKKILANVGLPIGGDHFNTKIFMDRLTKYFGSESRYGTAHIKLPSYIFINLSDWYKVSLLKTDDFLNSLLDFRYLNTDKKALDALGSLVKNNLGFSIYEEVERVKMNLSSQELDLLRFKAEKIDIQEEITKTYFENLIQEDIEGIRLKIRESLDSAGIEAKAIDYIATTGGSSLIPVIRQLLSKLFGKEKIVKSDAFTSVASGLAIRAKEVFN